MTNLGRNPAQMGGAFVGELLGGIAWEGRGLRYANTGLEGGPEEISLVLKGEPLTPGVKSGHCAARYLPGQSSVGFLV